ncbi:hypothetical protein [Schlesneria paludicola]|uniref:hypothetical protein n=1 Tax=Schlesneria paludicola TaxID=360056 RepID=UPI00029B3A39|nr:hypothetical protein [Schlesneria paludicola]
MSSRVVVRTDLTHVCGIGLMVVACLLQGTFAPSACSSEETPQLRAVDPTGEALRDVVIRSIRKNYSQLPSLRCKQITTSVDLTTPARSTVESDLLLASGNMRIESLHQEQNERWSVSMQNDVYTVLFPALKMARRTFREHLGEDNMDPRNVGVLGQKQKFLKELNLHQLLRHETIECDGSERLVFDLADEHVHTGMIVRTRYEFDPARNYLPTRIVGEDPAWGRVAWVQDCEYQEIIPGTAWFLKSSRLRYFNRRRSSRSDTKIWTKQVSTEIVGEVRTNEPIAESELEITIPDDVKFFDQTIGHSRPVR